MVKEIISLKALQQEIAKERKKAQTASERAILERELQQLRAGRSNKFLKRISRGFGVLVKKGAKETSKGVKRLRKFAIESGAAEGLKFDRASTSPVQRSVRTVRIIRRKPRSTTIIRRTTIRRVRVKPKKRRVVRRGPVDDGGFFGGLSTF